MKTNTIQIIRILCLRPALMPSRGFSAGIGAEPDPQKEELAKTKASSAPGGGVGGSFPVLLPPPGPRRWRQSIWNSFPRRHLGGLCRPVSQWGLWAPEDCWRVFLEGRAPYGGHEAASGSVEDEEALEGPLCWVNMLPLGWGLARAHLFVNVAVRGKKDVFSAAPANTEAAAELFPAARASE